EVLVVLAETVGFHPVEARALHPHEALERFFREERVDPEIAGLIFGPQDLALLAWRPGLPGTGASIEAPTETSTEVSAKAGA
ncbi:MAG: hypothetical protein AAF968_18030, partial [Pseudomonadota bacterium]